VEGVFGAGTSLDDGGVDPFVLTSLGPAYGYLHYADARSVSKIPALRMSSSADLSTGHAEAICFLFSPIDKIHYHIRAK
jgi:hypothetical protein